MAGPIIEALRRMRANRMERRGFGDGMGLGFRGGMRGGFIRDMLNLRPPVTQPEALNAVNEYRPMAAGATTTTGPLFSSIGTGSGRQDRRGYTVVRPAARQMNPDPDGPDTEYKRDYDGDGRPDPVQGGVEDLPAPDGAAAAGKQPNAVDVLSGKYRAISDRMGDPRLTDQERNALAVQATAVMADLKLAREDQQQATQRDAESLAAKLAQLEPVREQARLTGDWAPFGAAAGSYFVKTDKDGNPLPGQDFDAAGRNAAAPYIHDQVRGAMNKYREGLAEMPEPERVAMMRGLAYAHPMTMEDRKSPASVQAWQDALHAKLNAEFNLSGDDAMDEYFRAVTTLLRAQHLGR